MTVHTRRPKGYWDVASLAALISLLALPLNETAAAPKVKAELSGGHITIGGKTSANAPVSVYDTATNTLLYTVNADKKGRIPSTALPALASVPCSLRIESAGSKATIPVPGAAAACSAAIACRITKPAKDIAATEGQGVAFAAKVQGGAAVTYAWRFSDGSDASGAGFKKVFPNSGMIRALLTVSDASGRTCMDDLVVNVMPKLARALKFPKVPELKPAKTGQGLTGDKDSYVVMPFEEMGIIGGSQINQPFNPLIPYNALNAQLLKKVFDPTGKKPKFVPSNEVQVWYSAGSNPKDPAGKGSINSTSQNLFADGEAGVNFDPATSSGTNPGITDVTTMIDGHDYNQAVIAKTELWDRSHMPWVEAANAPQNADKNWDLKGTKINGKSIADTQNTSFLKLGVADPDQGFRGNVDDGVGLRSMPGRAAPYVKNDPQPFDFNAEQNSFVAQMIPVSDIDDQGRTNPYPVMRVQAKTKAGAVVATADAVLTAASETRCRECHARGQIAADDQVWRTPVGENELQDPADPDKPGPATGKGSFPDGKTPQTGAAGFTLANIWPPAIHNRFAMHWDETDKRYYNDNAYNAQYTNSLQPEQMGTSLDDNGLRRDRVAESRWLKPDGSTAATNPTNDPTWKLQLRLKFKSGEDYKPAEAAAPSWQDEEKAALWNTLLLHDYMVMYGIGGVTYSSQLADMTEDKAAAGPSRTSAPMYFCSSHHGSQNRHDVGVKGRSIPTTRSDYSRAFHAFHGKLQVYKADVAVGADGLPHHKGDLIRDERGHPKMLGGRGWDSQHNDNEGVPMQAAEDPNTHAVTYTPGKITDAALKNDWDDAGFPKDTNGESLYPVGEKIPTEENCEKCHSGPTEKGYRDIHHARGLKCDACHGDMLAVGNVWPNEKYDANLMGAGQYGEDKPDALSAADFRRPWLDEPDCGSCHVGDGNLGNTPAGHNHAAAAIASSDYYSAGVLKKAYDPADKTARTLDPVNARFAVMPTVEHRKELDNLGPDGQAGTADDAQGYHHYPVSQALYRKSADVHGSGPNGNLGCSACHGGSHAIWPNPDPNANDNLTARQLQGYDGNIMECSVCHLKDDFKDGKLALDGGDSNQSVGNGVRAGLLVDASSPRAYLAGPHGMHPVNDPYWWKFADKPAFEASGPNKGGWHNAFAKKPGPDGEDQCAACHGSDHRGTRLSKTPVDRIFVDENGKKVKVAKGTMIGCDLCHSIDKSFTATLPKLDPLPAHAPPAPAPVHIGAYPGGGGGGH